MKSKISAIIVGNDESQILADCIGSITFCEEILYIDLESQDNSIEIAKKFGCKIYSMNKIDVPIVEVAIERFVHEVRNRWVLLIDPDERIQPSLKDNIIEIIENSNSDPELGAIIVPWRFYFKKRKLRGTIWGHEMFKMILVNKDKVTFSNKIHSGKRMNPGTKSITIQNTNGESELIHLWVRSLTSFFEKHSRYLKFEGSKKYNEGVRVSLLKLIVTFPKEFIRCFFYMKGYKDGLLGFFLSIFWAVYNSVINFSIFQMQLKINSNLIPENEKNFDKM